MSEYQSDVFSDGGDVYGCYCFSTETRDACVFLLHSNGIEELLYVWFTSV